MPSLFDSTMCFSWFRIAFFCFVFAVCVCFAGSPIPGSTFYTLLWWCMQRVWHWIRIDRSRVMESQQLLSARWKIEMEGGISKQAAVFVARLDEKDAGNRIFNLWFLRMAYEYIEALSVLRSISILIRLFGYLPRLSIWTPSVFGCNHHFISPDVRLSICKIFIRFWR